MHSPAFDQSMNQQKQQELSWSLAPGQKPANLLNVMRQQARRISKCHSFTFLHLFSSSLLCNIQKQELYSTTYKICLIERLFCVSFVSCDRCCSYICFDCVCVYIYFPFEFNYMLISRSPKLFIIAYKLCNLFCVCRQCIAFDSFTIH